MSAEARQLLRWRDRSWLYRPAAGSLEPGEGVSVTSEHGPWRAPPLLPPICLTLAVRGGCAQACTYCAALGRERQETVGERTLEAAATLVAGSCREEGRPLLVGLHGLGEPLLDRGRVERRAALLARVAQREEVGLRLACTTGGVLADRAQWVAELFDSVVVSHDGPGPLQDEQRPLRGGGASLACVEATLDAVCGARRRPEMVGVRVTVTRASAQRQVEIAAYLLERFPLDVLFFHPVYAVRGRPGGELAPDPAVFVRHFVAARQLARRRGCELVAASCRVGEAHGRHCPPLQRNLTLTPGGRATVCFAALDDRADGRFFYARHDLGAGALVVDEARRSALLERCLEPWPQCRSCFNLAHCNMGCPSVCPLERDPGPVDCSIPRWIGFATLLEAAGERLGEQELERIEKEFPPPPCGGAS